jgi:hypothetical protein
MVELERVDRSQARFVGSAALALLLAAGCVAHRHRIGGGPTDLGETSARQFYVLFGLVRWNDVDVRRLNQDLVSYEVETRFGWTDALLAPLLLPFTATSRTVVVRR